MASPSRSQPADNSAGRATAQEAVAERHHGGARERRESNAAPPPAATVTTLSEDELSSAAQRERRKRILDATLALASKGGYDAVQMRAVAERADVAVGTLYRYFPSKVHLLVSALSREFEQIEGKRRPLAGQTPNERMHLPTFFRAMELSLALFQELARISDQPSPSRTSSPASDEPPPASVRP